MGPLILILILNYDKPYNLKNTNIEEWDSDLLSTLFLFIFLVTVVISERASLFNAVLVPLFTPLFYSTAIKSFLPNYVSELAFVDMIICFLFFLRYFIFHFSGSKLNKIIGNLALAVCWIYVFVGFFIMRIHFFVNS